MSSPQCSLDIGSLVDQHYQVLYRYAFRLSGSAAMAEDLTQETFCTAQMKLGQLRDAGNARGWLITILRNHFLQTRRHETIVWTQSLESMATEPESAADGAMDVDSERLQQVLGELPEVFRTPVILFYFEEFSYRQIAEQMGVPIGTVMSRLARAKAYLRSRLRSANAARHASTHRE